MTEYFKKYVSNTCAGSSNQHLFEMEKGEVRTGRVFYKILEGGEYDYSLLFSNIVDSTYADGQKSSKNKFGKGWQIIDAKVGKCKYIPLDKSVRELTDKDMVVTDMVQLTFDGFKERQVTPGEFFYTDPLKLSFEEGEYLCVEITFSGELIPYHEETMLPVFVKENGIFKYCKRMPFPGMIGCNRNVKARVGFLGDSITQGIGAPENSYLHWSALVGEKLGKNYSCWNLGIGYGRANDMASDGAWMYKALQNDIAIVCFGVNDIFQIKNYEQTKEDLTIIINKLAEKGIRIILQTIPPFDYEDDEAKKIWEDLNTYIRKELSKKAEYLFDVVKHIGDGPDNLHVAKYGGHPNPEGSKIWADALWHETRHLFE